MSSGTIDIMELMVALNNDIFYLLSPNSVYIISIVIYKYKIVLLEVLHCMEILIAIVNPKCDQRC